MKKLVKDGKTIWYNECCATIGEREPKALTPEAIRNVTIFFEQHANLVHETKTKETCVVLRIRSR